jgi:hypothetical protein
VLERHRNIDSYQVAREMGMLVEIEINDPFYDVTTETIAERVRNNKTAFETKF